MGQWSSDTVIMVKKLISGGGHLIIYDDFVFSSNNRNI